MRCVGCHAQTLPASRFCDQCGLEQKRRCTGCGRELRPDARFCNQCGARVQADATSGHVASVSAAPPLEAGERKQVTVLFADIRGATALIDGLDPELAMGLLDPALQAMSAAVQRFGGTVNRVQGDGIMALFGAPLASEDHAVRACLSAQAIIQGIAALHAGLEVRVGVNSGEVVIRAVGNDPHDYDAVGVTAHLAHRLEQLAAPGSACLSGRTALLARGAVELEQLGAKLLAGIAEPVEVFRLISAHERPGWEMRSATGMMTGFVGRDGDLRQLESALGRAWLGRGQVVTMVGEAGIGKSRLAHEFIGRVPQGGWTVVRASAFAHAESTPYRLAAEIVRAWLGVSRTDDLADVARKLTQSLTLLGLGPSQAGAAAPLQSLLDLKVTDPEWAQMSPDWRRDRILPVLSMVMLRESAVTPLLLLVEDLHWADPQSVQMIEALVDRMGGARLLLLTTARTAQRLPWAQAGHRSYCSSLPLAPLDAEAANALLGSVLGQEPDLAELRARIVARAGGTPLFLEEFSRALLEQGVVVRAAPSKTRGPALQITRSAEAIAIPASVQAILATRIDQLAPDERRLLQIASVIGKDVPSAILAGVAGLPRNVLHYRVTSLLAAEFLYEVLSGDPAQGADYTFKHALTQAVAYDGMLRRQQRELHARVLMTMEALADDRAEEMTETLAGHALRGEAWERAATLATRAGARANARSAYQSAIGFYEQAIQALSHLPETPETLAQAIDLRLGLRVALGPASEYRRVLEVMDQVRDLAIRLGDAHRIAQIEVSRSIGQSVLGMTRESVETGAAALALARALGDPATRLNAAYAYGQALWFAGELTLAEQIMTEHLHLARGALRLSSTGTSGTASVLMMVCLANTHSLLGDSDTALTLAGEAAEIAQQTGKPYDISYAHLAHGLAHLMAGDAARAAAALERALEVGRAAKIAVLLPSVARFLGPAWVAIGRREAALELTREAVLASRGSGALTAWCGLAHAHALPETEALAQLEESAALALDLGCRPLAVLVLRRLGEVKLSRASGAEAVATLRQAHELAQQIGMAGEARALAELMPGLET